MTNLILNSLEIRNFRGFRHLQIERLGRVNLIVGKNNIGKSSVLEALQLYANRASTPTFVWEIMRTRNEIKRPFVNVADMLSALKYLFYGRKDIRPNLDPIIIGPINPPAEKLSIKVDWSVTEILENGTHHTRPLELGEDYSNHTLAPRFTIQLEGHTLSYPIDPSLPQGILMLNSKEINCRFITAGGLNKEQIVELWDSVALTNLEKEVLNALRLIAPGVEGLNFVSLSIPATGERNPIVKIADIDEPLPLSSLGDGMQRTLGIALALVNAKDGILLVDEFENGLYYAVQLDLWRLIFRLARQLNVQVFAATHSLDCIEAFQRAAEEDHQEEGLLIRLDIKNDEVGATVFNEEELGIITRGQIEVR